MGQGSPAAGIFVFLLGFGLVVVAAAGFLPGDLPVWPGLLAGGALAALGVAIAVRELMRPPPLPAPKPATQAFLEKSRHALSAPRFEFPPVPEPAPAAEMTDTDRALASIGDEIKTLGREIDRAKVMYGTGKLSSEGYRSYVADLEKRRGELEAARARYLMGKR